MKKSTKMILTQNQKTYNTIASQFSNTRDRSWTEFDDFVGKYIKDGDKILDIGCGNGRVFDLLKNKKIDYLGIDISQGLINEANLKFNSYSNAKFSIGDILDLNYQNNFDIVICSAVLNHLPNNQTQQQSLNNIYNSLKPNGYLLLLNWNLWNLHNKKSWWKLKLFNPSEWFKNNWRGVTTFWGQTKLPLYYYAFTLGQLSKMLNQSGFKIIAKYHSLENKKVSWWQGRNLVHIARKQINY